MRKSSRITMAQMNSSNEHERNISSLRRSAASCAGAECDLLALILGTLIGVISGYIKWLDGLFMRFTDLFLALPLLPLLLVIILLFRDKLRRNSAPKLEFSSWSCS